MAKDQNIFDSLSRNRERRPQDGAPKNAPVKVIDSKAVAPTGIKPAKRNRKLPMIDFEEQDAAYKRA
jgi:hypothetical protein